MECLWKVGQPLLGGGEAGKVAELLERALCANMSETGNPVKIAVEEGDRRGPRSLVDPPEGRGETPRMRQGRLPASTRRVRTILDQELRHG